ncbi:MAG: ABC transporter ATP-binding protein [Bdellovibrionota bacterium]
MAERILQAESLSKSFGDFAAVKNLSFEVRQGECFGLLGPNGAGKSTLMGMLYGVNLRNGGKLHVFGLDPASHSRGIKKRLGVVTQDNCLDDGLTVEENMLIYAAFMGVPKDQRQRRVNELLDFMMLSHKKDGPIRFLSGGMKRRLVFVRALLGDPDLLILDEPTTGLDPAVRHLLWGKVRDLRSRGKTILLTTHYMHEAEILCDRILVMNKGENVAEGSPAQLIEKFSPGFVAVFEKNGREKALAEELGLLVHEDSSGVYVRAPKFEALLDFQSRCGRVAAQLRPANLEDVFLKLTGQELNADA